MYEFWNQDANLASGTINRLSQILGTLYSTKTEQNFLYHATNLLLELTSRSPDFNRSIFDTPLSECKFEVRVVCSCNCNNAACVLIMHVIAVYHKMLSKLICFPVVDNNLKIYLILLIDLYMYFNQSWEFLDLCP